MSESKSIFKNPTNDEINTLLFKEGQFPTIINDADDSAEDKKIGLGDHQGVKDIDKAKDSKIEIEDEKLGQGKPITNQESSNGTIKASDEISSKPIESKDDSKNNQNIQITNQNRSDTNKEIAESKNNSSVPAVNPQITSTSTNNTDPTQKTSNDDDDTGVTLHLRLPKKNVSNKK